ncbi:hypothetical protein KVR01_002058 [Diaporthe batatas]|uniref:uncharacterized protein n=1 Tax=Diaporthe batatas TaxID=748121 RepID=UPI001D04DD82|nr:uncharacterized protein KVR01_002058 [Diaporthe batatas]KAG8166369.1 hypothetical protein KVR01_002058 [Diaporthe batatas]
MAASRISQIAAHLNYPKGMLAGQVAIITGSGQGIGAEAARLFANEGALVVVSDIDAEKAASVAETINSAGGRALAVPGDMLDAGYIQTLVDKAAAFGQGKIHYIVNNAGYTYDGVIHKMTDKQWDTIMDLHTKAPFQLVRAAAPYFRVKDGEPRCIVNISSTSGVHGNAGQANYAVAKAGVTGLTKTIAKEWGPAFGVRSNTVAFGHILTRLTQAKEQGAFVTGPNGEKIALGIPTAQQATKDQYLDIPLRRPGPYDPSTTHLLLSTVFPVAVVAVVCCQSLCTTHRVVSPILSPRLYQHLSGNSGYTHDCPPRLESVYLCLLCQLSALGTVRIEKPEAESFATHVHDACSHHTRPGCYESLYGQCINTRVHSAITTWGICMLLGWQPIEESHAIQPKKKTEITRKPLVKMNAKQHGKRSETDRESLMHY